MMPALLPNRRPHRRRTLPEMEPVRLNKYLAHVLGISRRQADLRIAAGRVFVNGQPASLGKVVQPGRDTLVLDRQPITATGTRYTYLLLNKPVGYVCSRKQQ